MNEISSNEYFIQKKALLKQCLHLSEELISSLEEWESLSDILSKKDAVLQQLSEFEAAAGNAAENLAPDRKQELDQLIKLIQELDRDTIKQMRNEQENIMASLKTNMQGQKLMQYSSAPELSRGKLLDYKK